MALNFSPHFVCTPQPGLRQSSETNMKSAWSVLPLILATAMIGGAKRRRGGLQALNMTVADLLYFLNGYTGRLEGGPEWTHLDRYDIVAKSEGVGPRRHAAKGGNGAAYGAFPPWGSSGG